MEDLINAVKNRNYQEAEDLLLADICDVDTINGFGRVALHWATKTGDSSLVDLLLGKAPTLINQVDQDGFTPLDWAIQRGNHEAIVALTNAGGKVAADL